MRILGISELDNDAGVALVEDGRLVAAANEERFSRQKRHRGMPVLSIRYVLEEAGVSLADIDQIIVAKPDFRDELRYNNRDLLRYPWLGAAPVDLWTRAMTAAVMFGWRIPRNTTDIHTLAGQLNRYLTQSGVPRAKVRRVEHHRAHAACAYHASGWDDALLVTTDGQGGGVTASIYAGRSGDLECLHRVPVPHSLGLFYGAATKALGYKPGRHEGKVTGLAAFEAPDPECLELCRRLAQCKDMSLYAPHIYGAYPKMKKILSRCGPRPFASAFQVVLEDVVTEFVGAWVRKTGLSRVGLAGGVFGNVKLNQRIHELDCVSEIFVFPHMADGGLGYGACMEGFPWEPRPIRDVYWGPGFTDRQMEAALIRNEVEYERPANAPVDIAELLDNGKVVARFGGRMEYGPRALGNRSILYRPDEPAVNDWLNKALGRTEFMPFAPVTMWEHAQDCYLNTAGAERSAEYMTVTFACTPEMQASSPAVVHVDGTARPQLLRRETNPFYYDIIREFHARTGIPSIVNTSFNMHEEPIVCSPDDAIRAFRRGHLDALSLGPFLCLAGARTSAS